MPRGVPKSGKRAPKGSAKQAAPKGKVQKTSKRQAKVSAATETVNTPLKQAEVVDQYAAGVKYRNLVDGISVLAAANTNLGSSVLQEEINNQVELIAGFRRVAFGLSEAEQSSTGEAIEEAQDELDQEPTQVAQPTGGIIGTPIGAPVGATSFAPPVQQNNNHQ